MSQTEINEKVLQVYNDMEQTLAYYGTPTNWQRLANCQAYVARIDGMFILKSYNTIVAAICDNGVCYDFLRFVYGYTATSTQHIHKFMRQYGQGNGKLTYR